MALAQARCKQSVTCYHNGNHIALTGSLRGTSPGLNGRGFCFSGGHSRTVVTKAQDTKQIGATVPKKRAMNPNSLANLRPAWKPGEAGNPQGKQPTQPVITWALRRFVNMPWEQFKRLQPEQMTVAEALAWRAVMDGIDEEGYQAGTKSREMIMARLEPVESTNKTEVTVNTQVVVTKW